MKVKFKLLNNLAVIPKYSRDGDAALDIVATEYFVDEFGNHCYKTGLAWEIEDGFVGLLFPRSSVSKYDLLVANSVGVLDSNFRGEIMIKLKSTKEGGKIFQVGDRVAQLIILPIPKIEPVQVENIDTNTLRGESAFGSTGEK